MKKREILLVALTGIGGIIGSVLVGILILTLIIVGSYVFIIYSLTPEEPSIKEEQFEYRLEYEILGQRYEKCGKFVCYYDGLIDKGGGLGRRWEIRWANGEPFDVVKLADIDDEYSIVLDFPDAGYFMGDNEVYDYTPNYTKPEIKIYYSKLGRSARNAESYIEHYGFKVIDWYCDAPIEQTFKD